MATKPKYILSIGQNDLEELTDILSAGNHVPNATISTSQFYSLIKGRKMGKAAPGEDRKRLEDFFAETIAGHEVNHGWRFPYEVLDSPELIRLGWSAKRVQKAVQKYKEPKTKLKLVKKKVIPKSDKLLGAIDQYYKEISRYPLLKPHEEVELAKRVRQGDEQAKQKFTVSNLRLVPAIAKLYFDRGLSLLDLIGEGNLGLITAVEKFDLSYGCKFSTYANWRIKQTIRRALKEKVRNIRIPNYRFETLNKVRKAKNEFFVKHGCYPDKSELSEITGLPIEQINKTEKARNIVERNYSQDVSPEGIAIFDEPIENNASFEKVMKILSRNVSRRCLEIILSKWGLDGGVEKTFEEVGARFNLTREGVRQIEARGLNKVREEFKLPPKKHFQQNKS